MFAWLRWALRVMPANAIVLVCLPASADDAPLGRPLAYESPLLGMLTPLPPGALVGMHGGGAGAFARAPRGAFIGADAGWATMLASGSDPARGALAFGAHAGYQWGSGVSLSARFDDLGVTAPAGGSPLFFASGGARYSLPLVVMPFAEALFGAAFYGPHVSPGAALGLGVSLPIFRHLAIDLSGRDWIADIDGVVRHVPTVELGFSIGFAR